jgi:hypothetical protein
VDKPTSTGGKLRDFLKALPSATEFNAITQPDELLERDQKNVELLHLTFPQCELNKLTTMRSVTILAPPFAGSTTLKYLLQSAIRVQHPKQEKTNRSFWSRDQSKDDQLDFVALTSLSPTTLDSYHDEESQRFRRWLLKSLVPVLERLSKNTYKDQQFSSKDSKRDFAGSPGVVVLPIFWAAGIVLPGLAEMLINLVKITSNNAPIEGAVLHSTIARLKTEFVKHRVKLLLFVDSDDWFNHKNNQVFIKDWNEVEHILEDLVNIPPDSGSTTFEPFIPIIIKNSVRDGNKKDALKWPRLSESTINTVFTTLGGHDPREYFETSDGYSSLLEASAGYIGHVMSIMREAAANSPEHPISHNSLQSAIWHFGRNLMDSNNTYFKQVPPDDAKQSGQTNPQDLQQYFSSLSWPLYWKHRDTPIDKSSGTSELAQFAAKQDMQLQIMPKIQSAKTSEPEDVVLGNIKNFFLRNACNIGWLAASPTITSKPSFFGGPSPTELEGHWIWPNEILFQYLTVSRNAEALSFAPTDDLSTYSIGGVDTSVRSVHDLKGVGLPRHIVVPYIPGSASATQRQKTFIANNLEVPIPYWLFKSPKISGVVDGSRSVRDFQSGIGSHGYVVEAPEGDRGPRVFHRVGSVDLTDLLNQPFERFPLPLNQDDFFPRQNYLTNVQSTDNTSWLQRLFEANEGRFIHLFHMFGDDRGGPEPARLIRKHLRGFGVINPKGQLISNEHPIVSERDDRWNAALDDSLGGQNLRQYIEGLRPYLSVQAMNLLEKDGSGMYLFLESYRHRS